MRPQAASVAWVAVDNLHITLKFLGGVEDTRLPDVSAALARAVSVPAFEVQVLGLGAFPTPNRPRVLWAGVAPAPAFGELAVAVDQALVALGFPPEERPFTPHVTLGRVRDGRRDPALMQALVGAAARPFGVLPVARLCLMRSDLSSRGARYTELDGWPLPRA